MEPDCSIVKYLRNRGVEEEDLRKIEENKLDKNAIALMDDEDLKEYLPRHGDRICLKAFCRKAEPKGIEKRKNEVLNNLRRKLVQKDADEQDGSNRKKTYLCGNSHGKKATRKIEISWRHLDTSTGLLKQVRSRRGGGTRKVDVSRDSTIRDILAVAKQLYFNNETSKVGCMEDLSFELRDFIDCVLKDETETIVDMYKRTCLPILHFTMVTRPKQEDLEFLDEDSGSSELEIANCTDQESYRIQVEGMTEIISLAGCLPLTLKLSDKDTLVQGLCHFIVLGRVANVIERFKQGLQTCNILQKIQEVPDVFKGAFVSNLTYCLNADMVEQVFHIDENAWAPVGSNRFKKEKTTETHWRDFLQDLEDLEMLDKLMMFATGLKTVPPCGFSPQPTIEFAHVEDADNEYVSRFPRANTYALTLKIPVLDTYDEFKSNMVAAINTVSFFTNE